MNERDLLELVLGSRNKLANLLLGRQVHPMNRDAFQSADLRSMRVIDRDHAVQCRQGRQDRTADSARGAGEDNHFADQRISAAPQDNPTPKPISMTLSPTFSRPCDSGVLESDRDRRRYGIADALIIREDLVLVEGHRPHQIVDDELAGLMEHEQVDVPSAQVPHDSGAYRRTAVRRAS